MIEQARKKFELREVEKQVQKLWERGGLYKKTLDRMQGGKKYYFLDGPPYASGSIHLGTAWNKILKDCVLRFLLC
jgi:isoleucyl-tRNA synthetase